MTGTVPGDPASCSQAGGALRQLAARLRVAAGPAHDGFGRDEGPRADRVELAARRRLDLVEEALAASTSELDRVGSALQRHASELAEAVAASRVLVARARAAGLDVVDGTVVPAWGVTGVADGTADAVRDATAAALQAELDAVRHALATGWAQLGAAAAAAQHTLASHAVAVRR